MAIAPAPLSEVEWLEEKLSFGSADCPRCRSKHPLLFHPLNIPAQIHLGGESRTFSMYAVCPRIHQPILLGFGGQRFRADGEYRDVYWM